MIACQVWTKIKCFNGGPLVLSGQKQLAANHAKALRDEQFQHRAIPRARHGRYDHTMMRPIVNVPLIVVLRSGEVLPL